MYDDKSKPVYEQNQMMFSRAGKSTNNLYLAFQDKDKLKNIQSRVAAFLGKENEKDANKESMSQIDQVRNFMDIDGATGGDASHPIKKDSIGGGMMSPGGSVDANKITDVKL